MAARTSVTFSDSWTGHVRLQNLSKGTDSGDGFPRPYAPMVHFHSGFGFSLTYLAVSSDGYRAALDAWLDYWGLPDSPDFTNGVACEIRWAPYGPTIVEPIRYFWGWYSPPAGGGDWTLSGAGDSSYNGDYYGIGDYNGAPAYQNGAGRYLFLHGYGDYVVASVLDAWTYPAYAATGWDLPGNPWVTVGGSGSPPTVAERTPAEFDWKFYGPVGSAQVGDDWLEFDFALDWPGFHLMAEAGSLTPAWRERQAFTDDKVSYVGWQAVDEDHDMPRLRISGHSPSGPPEYDETGAHYGLGLVEDMTASLTLSAVIAAGETTGDAGLSLADTVYCEVEVRSAGRDLLYLDELHAATENGATWTNYADGEYPGTSDYLVEAPGNKFQLRRIGEVTSGEGNDESYAWTGVIYPPYILTPTWHPRDFDDTEGEERDGPNLDLGGMIVAPGVGEELILPTYSWKDYAAEVINPVLTATMVEEELDALDLNPQVERANNPEDPEGAKTVYHDRRCKLWAWPLLEDDYTQPPWFNGDADHRVLYIHHTGAVGVNVPPGLAERPSQWVGGEGAQVDDVDNDLWEVSGGQVAAVVYRNLETRFYYQMERLADHLDDPDYWHDEDAPRKLKANLPVVWEGYDEEDEGHVAVMEELSKPEDVTNWSNRSYLYAKLVGGAGLGVKVRLTYSTVEITDPWYTSFAYRFGAGGEFGEAEWEWSRTDGLVVTYSVDRDGLPMVLEAGDNELWIDLACPDENLVPILQHVDKIEFLFDSSGLTEPAQVTLDILSLRLSDREGEPWYETQHFLADSKQAWDWYRRNFFGVGWVVDGLPNAQVDMYGHRKFVNEKGFCYLKYRRHSPAYTGPFSDLTVAYPLSYLAAAFSWQEGLDAEYSEEALDYYTKDADGNYLGETAWWWIAEDVDRELRDDDHEEGPQQLRLGICVGTLDITHARGVPMVLYAAEGQETGGIEKHLGGKPHGIAKRGQKRARMKGGVRVYWRETAEGQETEWALLGSGTPDRHGRWRGPVCAEDGTTDHEHDRSREYRVGGTELGAAVARSYWCPAISIKTARGGVKMATHPGGMAIEAVWSDGEALRWRFLQARPNTWSADVTIATGDYTPADISVVASGKITVLAVDNADQHLYQWESDDGGKTWTARGDVT